MRVGARHELEDELARGYAPVRGAKDREGDADDTCACGDGLGICQALVGGDRKRQTENSKQCRDRIARRTNEQRKPKGPLGVPQVQERG